MEKVKEGRCATQAWKRSIILWAETFFYTFTLLLCTKTSEAEKHNYFDKERAKSIYVSNTKNTMNTGLQYRSAVCKCRRPTLLCTVTLAWGREAGDRHRHRHQH